MSMSETTYLCYNQNTIKPVLVKKLIIITKCKLTGCKQQAFKRPLKWCGKFCFSANLCRECKTKPKNIDTYGTVQPI